MSTTPRVGVFGGTFDPPHVGHVHVAADVADHLSLDRVLWVPARVSPFKQREETSPPEVRLEMVRRAAALDPRFEVDTRELERPPPSYTADTLEAIRGDFPDAELFLILGADQFEQFGRWRDPERIVAAARLAVMDRDETPARVFAPDVAEAVPGLRDATVFVPVRAVDVSSTAVREAVARGEDPAGSVPEGVARSIRARGLYRR
ncbi:MAG: nicotinate (nicotinamide) nucleotide adenylyltransferase [Gemmatimonadota bacterium]|nr:nicotinate (nicotinamide) nucleotide adenylyltransferase [Gemmatimonadota bacterium]